MAAKAATKKTATKQATKATAKPAPKAATKPGPKAKPARTVLTPDPVPALQSAPATAAAATGTPPYPPTPVLNTLPAILTLVLNAIVLPGLGTLVAAIAGHQKLIGRAVAQLFLAIVIVGYVWGIITGIQALINWSWGKKQGIVS